MQVFTKARLFRYPLAFNPVHADEHPGSRVVGVADLFAFQPGWSDQLVPMQHLPPSHPTNRRTTRAPIATSAISTIRPPAIATGYTQRGNPDAASRTVAKLLSAP